MQIEQIIQYMHIQGNIKIMLHNTKQRWERVEPLGNSESQVTVFITKWQQKKTVRLCNLFTVNEACKDWLGN